MCGDAAGLVGPIRDMAETAFPVYSECQRAVRTWTKFDVTDVQVNLAIRIALLC